MTYDEFLEEGFQIIYRIMGFIFLAMCIFMLVGAGILAFSNCAHYVYQYYKAIKEEKNNSPDDIEMVEPAQECSPWKDT